MTYNRKNPYYASLKTRFLLNNPGSTKSTYHVVLQTEPSKLSYKVGDSIGCLPLNDLELVLKVSTYFQSDNLFIETLQRKVNLSQGTKKLLKLIEANLPIGKQKAQLSHLISDKDTLLKYLDGNSLLNILHAYPVELPKDEFISSLRPMLPRLYSISSSPLMHPDEIHLTVSELIYTIQTKVHYGTGSRFLCHLTNKQEKIGVYIQPSHHFTLPEDHAPIIMIGPGTGIAPFRAFLQERQYKNAKGKNWLFFGERNKKFDFYYQDYFESLAKNQFLRISTAFSRDQKEKEYVQHKLYQNMKELFKWVKEGAYLYVCGDAKHMAKDVEKAFIQIFEQEGKLSNTEAKEYLKNMRKEKRYLTDVY